MMISQTLPKMNLKYIKYFHQNIKFRRLFQISSFIFNKDIFRPLIMLHIKAMYSTQEYHKAMIIHNKSKDLINIFFTYFNETLRINKRFTFDRKPEESTLYTLNRISAKLNDYAQKKAEQRNINDFEKIEIHLESKDGEPINCDDFTCLKAFTCINNYLKIGNILYTLDINPPMLLSLQLPSCIMAGYFLYPSELKGLYCNISETHLTWFKSKEKYNSIEEIKENSIKLKWEMFAEGFKIPISNDEISRLIKVVISYNYLYLIANFYRAICTLIDG